MRIKLVIVCIYIVFFKIVVAQEVAQKEKISEIKKIGDNIYEVSKTVLIEENMTPKQARNIAYTRCQHHAVGEHSGFWVETSQIVRESEYNNSNNSLFAKYGKITTKAKILNRKIIDEKYFVNNNQIFVTITARIEACEKNYNPQYNIVVNTNRSIFENGDELKLEIESTDDCFITLFLISPDDSLYVLFPLTKRRNNRLEKNDKLELPPYEDQKLKYTMELDNNVESQIDLLKIIATKNRYNFFDFGETTSYGNLRVNFQFILDWINSIPNNEIVEKDIPITVYNSNNKQ